MANSGQDSSPNLFDSTGSLGSFHCANTFCHIRTQPKTGNQVSRFRKAGKDPDCMDGWSGLVVTEMGLGTEERDTGSNGGPTT